MSKQNNLIVIAAILAGAAGIFAQQFKASVPEKSEVSSTLFNTQLPDLAGKPHVLTQWRGKILILNFWATWCPPCLSEIPEFIALQKQYADKNVQFVGIAVDEKSPVAEYNSKVNFNYPILIAGDAGVDMSKAWGNVISSVPFTVVINPQGQIIHRQLGEIKREELLAMIQPLIH